MWINGYLTFFEACAQLGITENNLYGNRKENQEDLIEDEDSLCLYGNSKMRNKVLRLLIKVMLKCFSKEEVIVQMMKSQWTVWKKLIKMIIRF